MADHQSFKPAIYLRSLFPRRVNRLAHKHRWIGPLPGAELLHAAAVDFGDIEVSFLIDAEAMHAPEATGEVAPYAPRVQEVPVEIIFQHLGSSAIEGPQCPVGADIKKVNVGGIL